MHHRWQIVLADGLTLASAAAAILLALFGVFRTAVADVPISIQWLHAAFLSLAVTLLRHVVAPRPSLLETLRAWREAVRRHRSLRDAMLAFWTTRPAVLLVGLLAVAAIGVNPAAPDAAARDQLSRLPARFDSGWYAGIADSGYEWQHRFDRQQNLAFFPAYPMLIRAVGIVTGAANPTLPRDRRTVRYAWAGLFISLTAFFWAAWYFSRIARELVDDERATGAVLLLAAYPFAIFFSAAYTESLFLLAAVGTWYHVRHRAWAAAAAWGLVAGLSRPNGFLLSVPLGLLALGVRDGGDPRTARGPITPAALAVAAAPAAGMLLFTLYVYRLTDVWFAWARLHGAWGRTLSADSVAFGALGSGAGLLQHAAAHPFQTLNAFGLAFALALVWPVWRTLGAAWAAFVIANIVPPLAAGGLMSIGRVTATLFPLFLALAMTASPRAQAGWVAVFGIVQGLAAALFFTWRELF